MDVRSNKVGSSRQKKPKHGFKHGGLDQFFQLLRIVFEALYDPRDAEATLLDHLGIIAGKNIQEGGHHITNNRERVGR